MRIEIIGSENTYDRWLLPKLLDHSWFQKSDVIYDQSGRCVIINLKRYNSIMRFIGNLLWINIIPPTIRCVLTIKDVKSCEIRNEDPDNPHRQEVISGGLCFLEDKVLFIGSFCEHENPYDIRIKVRSVNVTLEDT
ncbi:MAG: hypothetical protein ACYS32_05400 [Planctomycetota bacterium]|jgi:hypothetical protein